LEDNEKRWYAIHVLSGHENKVKAYLENEISLAGLENKITQILIPSEDVTEMRDGKRKVKTKVFFPGSMLIEAFLDKQTLHLFSNTPGITNFVGTRNKPQPLRQSEITRILGKGEEGKEKEKVDIPYTVGDPIKVVDGPFTDFTGFVEEINAEKSKLKVMVSIFGRSTPVELDFLQVELEK